MEDVSTMLAIALLGGSILKEPDESDSDSLIDRLFVTLSSPLRKTFLANMIFLQ